MIAAEIQISEKDYFIRAVEFKVWLCHKKKKFFEDLTSDESHELFDKFIKDWNRYSYIAHTCVSRRPAQSMCSESLWLNGGVLKGVWC